MKNYFFASILLIAGTASAQNPTPPVYTGTSVNYTRTWEATAPEQTPANLITRPLTDVKQTTEYFDGLGRPIQMVTRQASPLGNDLVVASTYDPFGREVYRYLPFVANVAQSGDVTNDGKFKKDAFQQQQAFYNTMFGGNPSVPNLSTGDAHWPYGQINYENSPLNRVLSTFEAGSNWVGSQSASTKHGISTLMMVNTPTDNVQIWNIGTAQGSIPTSAGVYGAGLLTKTVFTDEHGHQNITYTDSYGQVILKKVQNTAAADNGTGSAHAGWLCTYYVYDDFGNMRFFIPPAAVQQIDGIWNISQSVADEFCGRYEYDQLSRLIIKKNPGTPGGSQGEVWMVYDVRDRIVMTQDGNLRTGGQWLCFLYDGLDRQVATGLINWSGSLSTLQQMVTTQTTAAATASLQATLTLNSAGMSGDYQASQTITLDVGFSSLDNSTFIAEIIPASYNGGGLNIPVNAYPLPTGTAFTPLTASFFDNYSWLAGTGAPLSATLDASNTSNSAYFITSYNSSPTYAVQMAQSSQIQGMPTGQMVAVPQTGQNLYSLNIYDDHGRVIQSEATNSSGGKDVATNQYDWSGKLLRALVAHTKSGTNPQTHLMGSALSYDAMGRVLTITKLVNSTINGVAVNSAPTTVVSNQYNELGQLQQKTVGNSLETQNYEYNIRGWLLGMNRPYVKSGFTGNYFGFDLGYDQPVIATVSGSQIGTYAAPTFNGGISGTVWKSKGDNVPRKYDFSYDPTSRLTAADFNQQSGSTGGFDKTAGLDFSVSNLSYDPNGNIKTMNQNGWLLGGSQPIDQLVYSYANGNNSNRLMNVVDNSAYNGSHPQSTLGDLHYAGGKTAGGSSDYGYDNNGNATSDFNRSISSITYNYMSLPQVITITGKGTIQYVYDAAGNKLKKIVTDNSVAGKTITTTTTYLGVFIYKSRMTTPADPNNPDYIDVLQFIGEEAGRIGFIPAQGSAAARYVFDYFLRDHVENVRMVLTDEAQQDIYPAATIETASIGTEQAYYNITNDAAHVVAISTLPWWPSPSGTYPDNNGIPNPGNPNPNATSAQVYKLNGQTGDKFGLGIVVKVMAGDQISIFGKSVWHNTGTAPGSFPLSSAISSLLNVFAGASAVAGHSGVTGTALNGNSGITGGLSSLLNNTPGQPNPSTAPKAAINWVLFNDQFVPVSMGTDLVSSSGDVVKPHARLNLPMGANGYLYVYASNESAIDVYFDNLQIVNQRGPILEEAHYYPDGLLMAGISDQAWNKLPNYNHYQGNEMQNREFADGTGLEEYDFGARFYDPQLGRWHSQDPSVQFASPYVGMGNNWPNGKDPNGKLFLVDDVIVSAVGFAYGYISSGIKSGNWGWNSVKGGLIDAAIFEFGYLTAGGGLAAGANASTAATFLGNQAINVAVGQLFPSIPVQIGNFTFSAGPSFSLSGGLGASYGVSYKDGDFNFGVSFGVRGSETRVGGGVSYFDEANKQSFSLAITNFSGKDPQALWQAGYKKGDFSLALSEDWKLSGDKFRTFATEVSVGAFSVGVTLYTTDHSKEKKEDAPEPFTHSHWHNDHQWTEGSRISSALYAGYRDGNNIYRAGFDSPWVFDRTQNWFHHIGSNTPQWDAGFGTSAKPYGYAGSYDPYSLY